MNIFIDVTSSCRSVQNTGINLFRNAARASLGSYVIAGQKLRESLFRRPGYS
jgi:hypothetical protein